MNELDRIKIFINHLIVSKLVENQKGFGVIMGYNNESSISQILTGKVKTPNNFIGKLKSLFPELNCDWIEKGKGNMLVGKKDTLPNNAELISIPAEVWSIISNQAESLKSRDKQMDVMLESLKSKDAQTSEVIEMLKEQMKKSYRAERQFRAASSVVVVEDE